MNSRIQCDTRIGYSLADKCLALYTLSLGSFCLKIKTIAANTKRLQHRTIAQVCFALILAVASFAQSSDGGPREARPEQPTSNSGSQVVAQEKPSEGKQSNRILWVIPNYRAVSADAQLPPLSFRGKFKLATEDSFDYSSLLVAGFMAGTSLAKNETPEFHQGGAGYARYFWHSFTDQAVGNYFTEFSVPVIAREDPRYYTLGHGNVFRRTGYAVSRLLVTRTDSGHATFNFSEIVGNGAGAGISDLYYPRQERTWTKTGQKWITQVSLDGIFNVMKEFWPDVRQHIFHK